MAQLADARRFAMSHFPPLTSNDDTWNGAPTSPPSAPADMSNALAPPCSRPRLSGDIPPSQPDHGSLNNNSILGVHGQTNNTNRRRRLMRQMQRARQLDLQGVYTCREKTIDLSHLDCCTMVGLKVSQQCDLNDLWSAVVRPSNCSSIYRITHV